MNRSVDAAPACEFRVRCIGDGVDVLLGDVSLTKFDATISELDKHVEVSRFSGDSFCRHDNGRRRVYRELGSPTILIILSLSCQRQRIRLRISPGDIFHESSIDYSVCIEPVRLTVWRLSRVSLPELRGAWSGLQTPLHE
jgi:hypothetical protein